MSFRKWLVLTTFVMTVFCVTSLGSRSANAQGEFLHLPNYKVQLYYLYFDTDYHHWSTVYETSDPWTAELYRGYLQNAKNEGRLHQVARELSPGTSWRYICIDFRIVQETRRIPIYFDNVTVLKVKPKPRSIKRR